MANSARDWQPRKETVVYQAKGPDEFSLRVDELRFPSGRVGQYVFAQYPYEVCFILPMIDHERLVFIKQFRYPLGRELIEIPAGSPLPGESLEDCARRETEEETGYRPLKLEYLFPFYPSPGSADLKAHLFIGTELEAVSVDSDPDEVTRVMILEKNAALEAVDSGKIEHVGALLALLWLDRRAPTSEQRSPR